MFIIRASCSRNVHPWWMSIFAVTSAFSNVGYLPFTDNLYLFADDAIYLLVISTVQMLGNVLAPIGLRISVSIYRRVIEYTQLYFDVILFYT